MRVLLIDDEKLALDMLEVLLNKMDGMEIVGKYQNPEHALENLNRLKVDVIFLDMDMGGVHGIKFARKLVGEYSHIIIIFVTAHPQFALDAFDVDAIDYLLKPVSITRLSKAIAKAKDRLKVIKLYDNSEIVQTSESLYAYTMSNFRLKDYKQNVIKWRTKKVKELFVFLWHNRDIPIHKARIIEELWPNTDADKAMVLLHTTVYQLRKALKKNGIEKPVALLNDQYVLSVPLTSDIHELEELIQSEKVLPENVERVLELYSGDYLEEEGYSWATQHQLFLRQSFISYLDQFISDSMKNQVNHQLVEASLEKMLQLDIYNETFMQKLLKHYGETNNYKKLQIFFEKVKNQFVGELGIDVPKELKDIFTNYYYKLKPLNS
ncbi:response regulator [Cytobacillus massiliigabonensis]|uniref:response regulator n=1 Tax=Cytobacillus massiliigabonensis TaxID=1871011 RepID=UPI0015E09037|nr:response regulator [Cytobacillus massiliigabonensis]